MADRQRGVQIHRGIIYGSHARLLSDAERKLAPPDHTHRWTIFLTSATSPPPKAGDHDDMEYIPGGADDLSYLIKKVTFRLHETYANPNRVIDKPPFRVSETGWGEFQVPVRVQFIPEASEKPLTLAISIKLHHWGPPLEAPPIQPTPATSQPAIESAGGTAITTPAVDGGQPSSPVPKSEPVEPRVENGDVSMDEGSIIAVVEDTAENDKDKDKEKAQDGAEGTGSSEKKDESKANTGDNDNNVDMEETQDTVTAINPNTASESTTTSTTTAPAAAAAVVPAPTSIASKYPVHAWQYDELVFSDPPLAFYNILNDHPPTPLPAKNRRARDQREDHAQKKKKGRVSAIAASTNSSRAGTPVDGTAGTGATIIGIPGEPGSADVPLEFTAEMEKAEWNRLHETKRLVIEQMDKWRLKLIEEEKELAKLKEELARTPMPT